MNNEPIKQNGIKWGPFILRIPFIHMKFLTGEFLQGLIIAGATALAGAPANAVAPAIIRPCRNSPVRNFMCIKGILSVNGPHLIPLCFDTSLFTLIAPPYPLLNLLM